MTSYLQMKGFKASCVIVFYNKFSAFVKTAITSFPEVSTKQAGQWFEFSVRLALGLWGYFYKLVLVQFEYTLIATLHCK